MSFTETVHNRTVVAERTNFHYTLYYNVLFKTNVFGSILVTAM